MQRQVVQERRKLEVELNTLLKAKQSEIYGAFAALQNHFSDDIGYNELLMQDQGSMPNGPEKVFLNYVDELKGETDGLNRKLGEICSAQTPIPAVVEAVRQQTLGTKPNVVNSTRVAAAT